MNGRVLTATLIAVVSAVLVVSGAWKSGPTHSGPADTRVPAGTFSAAKARAALPKLTIADPGSMSGYDRDCGRGHLCVFGSPWTDDVTVPGGRNGCDTRNDILARDFTPGTIKFKPGTRSCKVLSGRLDDPYTGETIEFDTDRPREVQIEHVVSLGEAWRSGAHDWGLQRRKNFANDRLNLLAVDGPTNVDKSDDPLGEWMPPNDGYLCSLARITITLSHRYDLTITEAKRDVLADALGSCPKKRKAAGGDQR